MSSIKPFIIGASVRAKLIEAPTTPQAVPNLFGSIKITMQLVKHEY